MSLEPSSPSLLGHPLCLPARAVPPSSRAPSPDLPPTHSPSTGLGAAGELCGLGPSPEEVQAPLAFLASAGPDWSVPSQAAGLWNSPASHQTDRDTEAQKVRRLVCQRQDSNSHLSDTRPVLCLLPKSLLSLVMTVV